jgi:hypothetical protein
MPPGMPPQYPNQPVPVRKGKGPLFWILISLGALVVVVGCAFAVGGYLLFRTAKNAGFDTSLLANNPALAVTKMAVAANPDLETLSTDDRAGSITVRDKKSGDVLTLTFDPDKKTMVARDKDGKEVNFKISGDANGGSLEVNSSDGSVKFGATSTNTLPAWVPVYPGSSPQGTLSSTTDQGNQSAFSFTTKDSAQTVLDYYEKELTAAGMHKTSRGWGGYGGLLSAEDASKNRTLVLSIATTAEGSQCGLTVVEKN